MNHFCPLDSQFDFGLMEVRLTTGFPTPTTRVQTSALCFRPIKIKPYGQSLRRFALQQDPGDVKHVSLLSHHPLRMIYVVLLSVETEEKPGKDV